MSRAKFDPHDTQPFTTTNTINHMTGLPLPIAVIRTVPWPILVALVLLFIAGTTMWLDRHPFGGKKATNVPLAAPSIVPALPTMTPIAQLFEPSTQLSQVADFLRRGLSGYNASEVGALVSVNSDSFGRYEITFREFPPIAGQGIRPREQVRDLLEVFSLYQGEYTELSIIGQDDRTGEENLRLVFRKEVVIGTDWSGKDDHFISQHAVYARGPFWWMP